MTKVNADINFIQMANDIAKIKQAVLGNGVPGLCQRVTALEEAHKESHRKMGYFCGFCAGIGCVFGGCLTWIINLIR